MAAWHGRRYCSFLRCRSYFLKLEPRNNSAKQPSSTTNGNCHPPHCALGVYIRQMALNLSTRHAARLFRLQLWLILHHGLLAGTMARFDITAGQVADSVTPLHEAPVANFKRCAVLCGTVDSCLAFNYRSSGLCQLLPESMELCRAETAAAQLTAESGATLGVICPRTCLQVLRQDPAAPSGLYRLAGWTVPLLCDQELDAGGWTLMLTSVSKTWTPDGTIKLVLGRNQESPDISKDYSLLHHGDTLLSFGSGDRFVYRLVLKSVSL